MLGTLLEGPYNDLKNYRPDEFGTKVFGEFVDFLKPSSSLYYNLSNFDIPRIFGV